MTDTVQHFVSGIPFEERKWWEDPNCIAELYEWMAKSGNQPLNVSMFIRHAYDWEPHYRYMRSDHARQVMLEQARAEQRPSLPLAGEKACKDAKPGMTPSKDATGGMDASTAA